MKLYYIDPITFKQGTLPVGCKTVKDQITAEEHGSTKGCRTASFNDDVKDVNYILLLGSIK